MTAPFFEFGLFSPEVSLLIAFVIGISFGFFLEKGGLGNAKKIAGQFYFTDLTVFKVMFSAIVTAMLGLFIFSWIGFLDLSLIDFSHTYIIPYLVAGLLFGAGFVIGGLCPGTACVSSATGRIDGMVLLIGFIFGIFLFGETFGSFEEFLFSTPLYQISIPEYFGASFGLIVFLVVVVALLGFIGASKVEKIFAGKSKETNNSISKPKINILLGSFAFVSALVVMFLGNPYHQQYNIDEYNKIPFDETISLSINSEELAQMVLSRKKDFIVVDLRSSEKFEKYHIPSAVNYNDSLSLSEISTKGKKIIFYDQGNRTDERVVSKIKSELSDKFYFLEGGLNNWFNEILFPNLNIPRGLSPDEIDKAVRRSRFFGGTPKLKKAGISKGEKYMREGC
ncbi:MAG: hypothetical protein A2V66_00450 [Ignavibacteria bacterium RBG_13_36_8]|nr:MAG: hypothetical protein A2V66_00450 [Ignavibacteria bacterium RBG_13_36_8]